MREKKRERGEKEFLVKQSGNPSSRLLTNVGNAISRNILIAIVLDS